jgi:hypothetical protein
MLTRSSLCLRAAKEAATKSSNNPVVSSPNPLPKGNQLRWLWRTFGVGEKFKRTPLPPKPYEENHDKMVALKDRAEEERIAGVDPERPHYRDPKFESREKVPFFDFFGFNRDWSYSLGKLGVLTIIVMFVKELQAAVVLQENAMKMQAEQPRATPEDVETFTATERELRAAGFAVVGYRQLDNVGKRQDSQLGKSS